MNETKILNLIEYIKTQLGHPVVNIEATDDMIKTFIFSAISKLAEFNSDVCYKEVPAVPCQHFEAETVIRVYNNTMISTSTAEPDVFKSRVFNMSSSGNLKEIIIDNAYYSYSQQVLPYSFKFHDDTLYLDGLTGIVTVEYVPKTEEALLSSVNIDWIRRYSLALTKECLGRIRGKYTSQSSPFTLDNESLLSEAQDEKQRLEEELQDRGTGFFFVDSDY